MIVNFSVADVKLRKEERLLKWAFRARDATPSEREEIAEEHGVRWSVLNELAEWWPSSCSPPDMMHAAYLGTYYMSVAHNMIMCAH